MANIVVYDPLDSRVPNRVTGYYMSANTPDFDPIVDKLVNPDLSALVGVPQSHWKYDGADAIVEMSTAEKNAVDSYSDTFLVDTVTSGKIHKREWFAVDEGAGVYSGLARDEAYTWDSNILKSVVSQRYYKDGSVVSGSVVTTRYYTTGDGRKVTKVTS